MSLLEHRLVKLHRRHNQPMSVDFEAGLCVALLSRQALVRVFSFGVYFLHLLTYRTQTW